MWEKGGAVKKKKSLSGAEPESPSETSALSASLAMLPSSISMSKGSVASSNAAASTVAATSASGSASAGTLSSAFV